jgi:hypothetical protein
VSQRAICKNAHNEYDDPNQSEVIRLGIAVWRAPGAKETLMTGTLEVQCCESVQAGAGRDSWQPVG